MCFDQLVCDCAQLSMTVTRYCGGRAIWNEEGGFLPRKNRGNEN